MCKLLPNEYDASGIGFPEGAHCVIVFSSTIHVDPEPPSSSLSAQNGFACGVRHQCQTHRERMKRIVVV